MNVHETVATAFGHTAAGLAPFAVFTMAGPAELIHAMHETFCELRRDLMTAWYDADGFIPHGFCLAWDPNLVAAIVLSNALIALAYGIITVVLVLNAVGPRPAVSRWLYWAYAGFICTCGVSHVLDDVTLWLPIYRLQAVTLGVTALASLVAAVMPISIWVTREANRWRQDRRHIP